MDDIEIQRSRLHRRASSALYLAVIGLVSSVVIVGGIFGIFAVIVGRRALRAIDASGLTIRGRGMARAGIAIGYLAIAASLFALAAWIIFPRLAPPRKKTAPIQHVEPSSQP
jgi:hypothetical protein